MVKELFKASVIGACLVLLLCASANAYSGPFEFGSKVKSEDTDISRLVHGYTRMPQVWFWDANGNGFDRGDFIYLHFNNSSQRTDIDDVRLTRYYDLMPGSKVRSIDEDFSRMLTFLSGWRIVFADSYSSAGYSLDDGVYIHMDAGHSGVVGQGDVRLTPFSNIASGTIVCQGDLDAGRPVTTLVQTIRFYNENGDETISGVPIYDFPDDVYMDISLDNASPCGFVVVNNVRLSV